MKAGQLGSLRVEVAANVARFQSDMGKVAQIAQNNANQVQKAFDVVGTSLKALGAGFAVGITIDKVKANIEGAVKAAAGLQQMAERTGATVEGLSGLASAAKLSGTDTDALAGGLQKLSKAMVDAQGGGKLTTAAFGAIGMSVKDLKGQTPDQTFLAIALRLAQYADGAEKTALAQALLGKSGANLLPVMNDLAAVGSLQVKVTAAQAQQADEYEKTLVRLNAAQNQIYKRIAFELLPVMSAFAETMLESAKQGNGLNKAVNNLASDGSLRAWAEDGALAVGTTVEAVLALIRTARAVGGSFQVVAADIALPFQVANAAGSPGSLGARIVGIKKALDERNQTVADANKRYDELWNGNATAFTDGLKKRFAAQRRAEIFGGGPGGTGPDGPRKALNFDPKGEGADAAGDKFIEQLQRQVQQQEKGRFEMLRLEATQKGVSAEAEVYITKLETIELRTKELASLNEHWLAAEEDRAKLGQFQSNGGALVVSLREQVSLLGLNATQLRRVTELRKLDALAIKAMAEASVDTMPAVIKQFDTLRAKLIDSLDDIEAAENRLSASFEHGATKAFDEYLKNARDTSKYAENLITGSLQRVEDALINFAKTGKLSFSDLFSFMAEEYLRQQIRMSIADFSTGGKGAGGASLLASAVSGFKSLSGYANGMPYVPYDNFPAMLHEGERVLTKAEAQGGGWSGGTSVSVGAGQVINIGQGVSRAEVYAAVSKANATNRDVIMRTLRQQGVAA